MYLLQLLCLVSWNSPSHPDLHLAGATRWDTHSTTMHNKATADRFNAAAANSIEEHKTAVLSQMYPLFSGPEAAAVIKNLILLRKFSPRIKSPSLTSYLGLSRPLIFSVFLSCTLSTFYRGGDTCPWQLLLPVHLSQGSASLFVPCQSPNSMVVWLCATLCIASSSLQTLLSPLYHRERLWWSYEPQNTSMNNCEQHKCIAHFCPEVFCSCCCQLNYRQDLFGQLSPSFLPGLRGRLCPAGAHSPLG